MKKIQIVAILIFALFSFGIFAAPSEGELLQAVEAAKAKSGENSAEVADCYKTLGDFYYSDSSMNIVAMEKQKSACDYYQKACAIFEKLGNQPAKLAEASAMLGICLGELNDFGNSEKYLKIAESLLAKSGANSLLLADVYQEFGYIAVDNEKSIEYSMKAKNIAEKTALSYKPEERNNALAVLCKALSNAAVSYENMGDAQKAQLYYEDGMRILTQNNAKNTPIYVKNLTNLALLYGNANNFAKADELLAQAKEVSKAVWGDFSDPMRRCERGMAIISRYKKQNEEEIKHRIATRDISLKVFGENNSYTAEAYRSLSDAYRRSKDYKNATENAKKALELQTKIYGAESPAIGDSFRSLGNIYYETKDFKNAEKSWMSQLNLFENSNKFNSILTVCWQNITLRMKDTKADWTAFIQKSIEVATSAVERARVSAVGSIKNAILAKAAPFYYTGIDLALKGKKQDVAKAFDYSESLRSRGFLDQIGTEVALSLPGINAADAEKVRLLENKLTAAREELNNYLSVESSVRDSSKLGTLTKQIEDDEKELAQLEKKLAAQNPKYTQLRNPSPSNMADAQKFCGANQAIVEFVLWNNDYAKTLNDGGDMKFKIGSYAIVITTKKVFAVPLEDFDYEGSVNSLRNKILSVSEEGDFETERNDLYKKLLSNVIKQLPKNVNSLMIVPDGSLAFLPFDILRESASAKELGAVYEIVFSPSVSISILKGSMKVASGSEGKMLAMGGGWYNSSQDAAQHRGNYSAESRGAQSRGLGGGKKVVDETPNLTESALRDIIRLKGAGSYFKGINLVWNDLPGTLTEVEALEKNAPKGKVIQTIKQENVTEANVKSLSQNGELGSYAQLHFACHGYFDSKIPEMCGIVFSEVSQSNAKEDGYLTVPEILHLNMNSDFVCLSACETGLGRVKVGDGLTGLSRAFMVSGSKKVGVTLWCVDDAATCEFMISLYKKVAEGKSYSKAYFETRKEFRDGNKNKDWKHPYYRSAFVLYE